MSKADNLASLVDVFEFDTTTGRASGSSLPNTTGTLGRLFLLTTADGNADPALYQRIANNSNDADWESVGVGGGLESYTDTEQTAAIGTDIVEGTVWYNTTDDTVKYYTGTQIVTLADTVAISGLVADVASVNTRVDTTNTRIDGLPVPAITEVNVRTHGPANFILNDALLNGVTDLVGIYDVGPLQITTTASTQLTSNTDGVTPPSTIDLVIRDGVGVELLLVEGVITINSDGNIDEQVTTVELPAGVLDMELHFNFRFPLGTTGIQYGWTDLTVAVGQVDVIDDFLRAVLRDELDVTTVIANPDGTDGDDLTRVSIDGTEYNLSGGGGTGSGIEVLADDPASPTEGQVWYNSTADVIRYYDGTDIDTVVDRDFYDATTGITVHHAISGVPININYDGTSGNTREGDLVIATAGDYTIAATIHLDSWFGSFGQGQWRITLRDEAGIPVVNRTISVNSDQVDVTKNLVADGLTAQTYTLTTALISNVNINEWRVTANALINDHDSIDVDPLVYEDFDDRYVPTEDEAPLARRGTWMAVVGDDVTFEDARTTPEVALRGTVDSITRIATLSSTSTGGVPVDAAAATHFRMNGVPIANVVDFATGETTQVGWLLLQPEQTNIARYFCQLDVAATATLNSVSEDVVTGVTPSSSSLDLLVELVSAIDVSVGVNGVVNQADASGTATSLYLTTTEFAVGEIADVNDINLAINLATQANIQIGLNSIGFLDIIDADIIGGAPQAFVQNTNTIVGSFTARTAAPRVTLTIRVTAGNPTGTTTDPDAMGTVLVASQWDVFIRQTPATGGDGSAIVSDILTPISGGYLVLEPTGLTATEGTLVTYDVIVRHSDFSGVILATPVVTINGSIEPELHPQFGDFLDGRFGGQGTPGANHLGDLIDVNTLTEGIALALDPVDTSDDSIITQATAATPFALELEQQSNVPLVLTISVDRQSDFTDFESLVVGSKIHVPVGASPNEDTEYLTLIANPIVRTNTVELEGRPTQALADGIRSVDGVTVVRQSTGSSFDAIHFRYDLLTATQLGADSIVVLENGLEYTLPTDHFWGAASISTEPTSVFPRSEHDALATRVTTDEGALTAEVVNRESGDATINSRIDAIVAASHHEWQGGEITGEYDNSPDPANNLFFSVNEADDDIVIINDGTDHGGTADDGTYSTVTIQRDGVYGLTWHFDRLVYSISTFGRQIINFEVRDASNDDVIATFPETVTLQDTDSAVQAERRNFNIATTANLLSGTEIYLNLVITSEEFDVPDGSTVPALTTFGVNQLGGTFNISTTQQGIGGGGTVVAANPDGTDGDDLTRIAIGGTNFNISEGVEKVTVAVGGSLPAANTYEDGDVISVIGGTLDGLYINLSASTWQRLVTPSGTQTDMIVGDGSTLAITEVINPIADARIAAADIDDLNGIPAAADGTGTVTRQLVYTVASDSYSWIDSTTGGTTTINVAAFETIDSFADRTTEDGIFYQGRLRRVVTGTTTVFDIRVLRGVLATGVITTFQDDTNTVEATAQTEFDAIIADPTSVTYT